MSSKYKNIDLNYIKFNNNTFYVKWQLTRWCNFSCPFCSSRKDNVLVSQEEINQKAISLNNLLLSINKKAFKLKFIGGECCVYDLIQIIDKFTIPVKSISIVTNFYRELDYYKNLYSYCRKRKIEFLLNCSWHDQNIDFDNKFYELTYWCRQMNFKEPMVIFVLRNEEDCELVEKYKTNNINRISILLERDQNGKVISKSFTRDYFQKFNSTKIQLDSGKYLVSFKHENIQCNSLSWLMNSFEEGGFITEGRLCNAGINSIAVNSDGKIYKDSCRYLYENKDMLIGNIDENKLELPIKPIICHVNSYKNNKDIRCVLCTEHGLGKITDHNAYSKIISEVSNDEQ